MSAPSDSPTKELQKTLLDRKIVGEDVETFDFSKYTDKESTIEFCYIVDSGKPSQFKNGSSRFLSIESKSLGVYEYQKAENVTQEMEITAKEVFSIIERDGKINWSSSGTLANLLRLAKVENPMDLVGKKIRTAKKMRKSGKEYIGWNLI